MMMIMIDHDDSILMNIGAPCNVCLNEDERYATIIRFKDNNWFIEARGVRNTVGFVSCIQHSLGV